MVPGQVLSIPGVSVPAVCAVRWDDPGARLERAWYLVRCSLSLGSLFPQCVQLGGMTQVLGWRGRGFSQDTHLIECFSLSSLSKINNKRLSIIEYLY